MIDKYRDANCPACGESHELDITKPQSLICICGIALRMIEDEVDGNLRYLLEIIPEEELFKWKLFTDGEPYFQDFISFNDDNQK